MMINKTPKISVLVATYNAEPFIAQTIEAVLAQTFTDFELVILDDASTDATAKIVAEFTDKRIVFLQNSKNLGISDTRNKLLQKAKGEYIAILDHDDICMPNRLEIQADFLDNNKDIAMAGTWFELFCPKTAPWWRRAIVNMGWVWCHPCNPTWDDALKGNVLMHPTIMFRRNALAKNNIFYRKEYSPAEDYDLVVQALAAGLRLANIPKILLKYSLHGGNLSIRAKKQMQKADCSVKNNIVKLLKKKHWKNYPYWLVMIEKLRLKFMLR